MKAIIRINYDEYLVSDAKKALALVEMLQQSERVARPVGYKPDEITLSSEPVRVEMCSLPASTKIIPAKKEKA